MQPKNKNTKDKSSSDSMQTLIPTKNKPALLSYYFGVFGLIPLIGLISTIVAIILGIIGLSRYKTNPTPGAKGHALAGLTLGIFELVSFFGFIVFMVLARTSSNS